MSVSFGLPTANLGKLATRATPTLFCRRLWKFLVLLSWVVIRFSSFKISWHVTSNAAPSRTVCEHSLIVHVVSTPFLEHGQQNDAAECLLAFLNIIESRSDLSEEATAALPAIAKLFTADFQQVTNCVECDYSNSKHSLTYVVDLPLACGTLGRRQLQVRFVVGTTRTYNRIQKELF